MATFLASPSGMAALSTRLSRLAALTPAELDVLRRAEREQRRSPARRELIGEGEPIRERRAVLGGWACRQHVLPEGQRQILSVLLPGDLIGVCQHRSPLATTAILAINELVTCPAPAADPSGGMARAYALSSALEQYHLRAQIIRLGRMNAYERMADWLLETRERLALVDMASGDQFMLPVTQEMLADTLGLTSVHVNRTLQAMRSDGMIRLHGGHIQLPDRAALEALVDYKSPRVDAGAVPDLTGAGG